MKEEIKYRTQGTLFFFDTVKNKKGIIGLAQSDFIPMVSLGFCDEEVGINIYAITNGQYAQSRPDFTLWASLLTIKMEDTPKFQIGLSARSVEELEARGFRDLQDVTLEISKLPFNRPVEQFNPEDYKFEF